MDREAKRAEFLQDVLAAWVHYQATGIHVTAEEADAWMRKLEGGEQTVAG